MKPRVYNIDRIIAEARSGSGTQRALWSGEYVAARPLSGGPWWRRFTIAYRVFTGRYDALSWTEQ